MTVALSVWTSGMNTGKSTNVTVSHSDPAKCNYVIVMLMARGAGSAISGVSATYDGITMTSLGSATYAADYEYVQAWYLPYPAAGTRNAVVTWSSPSSNAIVSVATFTGCGAPIGLQTQNAGAGDPSLTVTSATGDVVVDCLAAYRDGAAGFVVGSGQTQRTYEQDLDTDYYVRGAASTEAGASSVAMTWTNTDSRAYAHLAFNVPAGNPPVIGTIAYSPFMQY